MIQPHMERTNGEFKIIKGTSVNYNCTTNNKVGLNLSNSVLGNRLVGENISSTGNSAFQCVIDWDKVSVL